MSSVTNSLSKVAMPNHLKVDIDIEVQKINELAQCHIKTIKQTRNLSISDFQTWEKFWGFLKRDYPALSETTPEITYIDKDDDKVLVGSEAEYYLAFGHFEDAINGKCALRFKVTGRNQSTCPNTGTNSTDQRVAQAAAKSTIPLVTPKDLDLPNHNANQNKAAEKPHKAQSALVWQELTDQPLRINGNQRIYVRPGQKIIFQFSQELPHNNSKGAKNRNTELKIKFIGGYKGENVVDQNDLNHTIIPNSTNDSSDYTRELPLTTPRNPGRYIAEYQLFSKGSCFGEPVTLDIIVSHNPEWKKMMDLRKDDHILIQDIEIQPEFKQGMQALMAKPEFKDVPINTIYSALKKADGNIDRAQTILARQKAMMNNQFFQLKGREKKDINHQIRQLEMEKNNDELLKIVCKFCPDATNEEAEKAFHESNRRVRLTIKNLIARSVTNSTGIAESDDDSDS